MSRYLNGASTEVKGRINRRIERLDYVVGVPQLGETTQLQGCRSLRVRVGSCCIRGAHGPVRWGFTGTSGIGPRWLEESRKNSGKKEKEPGALCEKLGEVN